MTKFADQLYDDLVREHGPALASLQRPVAARRHVPSRRTLLAAGAGCVAVAGTAGALVAGGGTPAYALSTHPDGTATLAVYSESGIAQVNAKLHELGDQVIVVPVHPWCPSLTSLRPPAVKPAGPVQVQGSSSRDGSITVQARGIPAGDILVVATQTTTHGHAVMQATTARLTSAPAPSCVSAPPPPPPGPGSGHQSGSGQTTQTGGSGLSNG
jgi:hypothetical protein